MLVAPINGLCVGSWGKAFVKAAFAVGFNFEAGHSGPLLPRVGVSGELVARAVGTADVTRWLNALLERVLEKHPQNGLTSHGLKSTALSWMAKSGYSESTRLILGHHNMKGRRTLETYSRGIMAPYHIQSGSFLPDRTRSGYVCQSSAGLGTEPTGGPYMSFLVTKPVQLAALNLRLTLNWSASIWARQCVTNTKPHLQMMLLLHHANRKEVRQGFLRMSDRLNERLWKTKNKVLNSIHARATVRHPVAQVHRDPKATGLSKEKHLQLGH